MRCGRCLLTGFSLVVASGELICDNCASSNGFCAAPFVGPPSFAGSARAPDASYAGPPGRPAQLDGTRLVEVERPLALLALRGRRFERTSLSSHNWTFLSQLIASRT